MVLSRVWTCALLALSLAAAMPDRAEAQDEAEIVDFFVIGGALRGLDETTWTAESGFIYRPEGSRWGIGFAYTNDGHLFNNHRDGLVAQGWYVHPLTDTLELQAGTGPYASMNNTTNNGVRENQFRTGLFTSVALKWYPFDRGNRWYLRAQFNNTFVPGSFNSNALLVGAGRDFISAEDLASQTQLHADISVWAGTSRTTQLGEQRSATAHQLEAQFHVEPVEHWWLPDAYSIGFLSEGDTGLVHRTGGMAQAWWAPATKRFTFAFGVGPYIAYDTYREKNINALGILSLRILYEFASTRHSALEAGFMYTRIASFYNRDQDIFMLGLRLLEKR